jgi:hypothetical protein
MRTRGISEKRGGEGRVEWGITRVRAIPDPELRMNLTKMG